MTKVVMAGEAKAQAEADGWSGSSEASNGDSVSERKGIGPSVPAVIVEGTRIDRRWEPLGTSLPLEAAQAVMLETACTVPSEPSTFDDDDF